MNAGDKAHRTGGERRLAVGEKCSGPRHRYGQVVGVDYPAIVTNTGGGRIGFVEHAEKIALTVHDRDHHGSAVYCMRRSVDGVENVGRRQSNRVIGKIPRRINLLSAKKRREQSETR